MRVRPARLDDLPQVRRLLQTSPRAFLRCGLEDLPDLLRQEICVLGVHEGSGEAAWGFLALQHQSRPVTLPETAPDPATLPALAVVQQVNVQQGLRALLELAVDALPRGQHPIRIVVLPTESWLIYGLKAAGFQEVEQIRFYHRTRRSAPDAPEVVRLRPLGQHELPALAELDSAAFDSLWHMGEADLLQLCLRCRMQVAERDGRLVGYTALAVRHGADPFDDGDAQLVRLAVHPAYRRQGIARQLLADSILYALHEGVYHVHLNTQESNRASQRLYESVHFRRHGRNIPVLVRMAP